MNEEIKQKKFYALNLTEGRILIIFICVVLFITVIAFCVTFLFFNKNKSNNLKVRTSETVNSDDNKKDFYSMEDEADGNLINENSGLKEDEINKESSEAISTLSEIDGNKNSKSDNKTILTNKTKTGEQDGADITKSNDDVLKIDNSEVLYSSKYATTENKTYYKSLEEKKQTYVKPKEVQKKKEISKKYIVQIGSYSSKKTAEDVHVFYQKQGYPAFIITKEINGKTFFRLRVGPFKEKDHAVKQLNDLKKSKYGENSYLSIIYI